MWAFQNHHNVLSALHIPFRKLATLLFDTDVNFLLTISHIKYNLLLSVYLLLTR